MHKNIHKYDRYFLLIKYYMCTIRYGVGDVMIMVLWVENTIQENLDL